MSPTKIPGELAVSFRYTPGVGNTSFFEALRDRGVFLGSRCETCAVTYLPARVFCERCLAELDPSIECGPEGRLAFVERAPHVHVLGTLTRENEGHFGLALQ